MRYNLGDDMKKSIVLFGFCLSVLTGWSSEGWMTDFEGAKKKAATENKVLLLDFTGSDWCSWCIKLDEEVFQKDAWKAYAKDHLVQVLIDFPRDKSEQSEVLQKQNNELAKQYGVRGFPTVLLLNQEGALIEKTGYQRGGTENYIVHIKELIGAAEK
ncbi:MAG TPA: thiol-disulfide isomerase [Verrucomicrobia bacterium]|nr:thiol-disulfide isomerase [Verrucomicrobiota bacterium]